MPYGASSLGAFGNGKPGPWRAGANENTVFAVSSAVIIEDKPLPAGRYGLHMVPGKDEWTLIFLKNANAWGSFFYDQAEDVVSFRQACERPQKPITRANNSRVSGKHA